MTQAPPALTRILHHGVKLLALSALLSCSFAYADDYQDVNQLLRLGKPAEALVRAEKYLAGKPRDPQMRFLFGVAQSESGKTSEATATFVKLTEDFPELPEPYNNLAVVYASQGQYDKARIALEMAIRTNPSYATAQENLGDVYARLASQAYNKALQLDASNTAVQPKLALIRDLFTPGTKGARPVASTPAPSAKPAPVSVAAAPVAAAPVAAAPVTAAAVTPAAPAAAPVQAAPAPAAPAPSSTQTSAGSSAQKDIEAAVMAWAAAWSSKDMDAYLNAYGTDFDPPRKASRKAWEQERRARIVGKTEIQVKVSDLSADVTGDKARVRFQQAYSAGKLQVSSRKTLDMVKTGERWLIVRESTGG